MKKLSILLFALVLSCKLFSQDLIVTNDGDSLNCKILSHTDEKTYFLYKLDDKIVKTFLPSNKFKKYKINYFKTSEIPADYPIEIPAKPKFQHLKLVIDYGWSYRMKDVSSNVSPDLKNYVQGLKSGQNFGADLVYYFMESTGVGIKYNQFMKNSSLGGNEIAAKYGTVSDAISISYIGPSLNTRLLSNNKKQALMFDLSIGYMSYEDISNLTYNSTISGNGLSFVCDAGYDFNISKFLALGVKGSFIWGKLPSFDVKANGISPAFAWAENYDCENLTRFDLSIGLRFNR
jgi:hypothetical protein